MAGLYSDDLEFIFVVGHPLRFDTAPFVHGRCKTPIAEIQAALLLIRAVPGFDKNAMTAVQVLSEIGGDTSFFPTAKHLVTNVSKHAVVTGHRKAIIAVCRMILTAIWHMLTALKPYAPDGFLESRPVNKEKVLTTSQALNLFRQRGYLIKDDSLPEYSLSTTSLFQTSSLHLHSIFNIIVIANNR